MSESYTIHELPDSGREIRHASGTIVIETLADRRRQRTMLLDDLAALQQRLDDFEANAPAEVLSDG